MVINKIKLGNKIYDTWSTREDVELASSEISNKLGSSQDTSLSNTIFGLLKSIKDYLMNLIDSMSSVPYAKESTSQEILNEVQNIDIDTTELAKETTLNDVSNKIDNIDLSKVAKESTLLTESQAIQSAIQNIDLSSVESKVEEVKQAVENIDLTPIESKVDEGVSTLSTKIDNIDLSAVENKVQEESAAIQAKIDNIKLPEIDTTELAKQGGNQEATNSAILSVLNGVAASMYKGVPIVSQSGDATISPNVWNVWGEVTSLSITKGNDIDGITNQYLLRIVAGKNLQVSFIGFDLVWYGGYAPTWDEGTTYEISIIDNMAIYTEFK